MTLLRSALLLTLSIAAAGCAASKPKVRTHKKFAQNNNVVAHWVGKNGRSFALVRAPSGHMLRTYAMLGPEDGQRYYTYKYVAMVKPDGKCAAVNIADGSYWKKTNIRSRSGREWEVHHKQQASEIQTRQHDCEERYAGTAAWPVIQAYFEEQEGK